MQSISEAIHEVGDKIMGMKNMPQDTITKQPSTCDPNCEICGGIGWIRYNVPQDHYLFGKIEPCPNMARAKLLEVGNFGLRWDEQLDLSWKSVRKYNNAIEAAKRVKAELDKQPGAWIFMHGEWGLAKSLILKVAVAEMLRAGRHSYYISMVDMLDDLKLAFDEEDQTRALNERIIKWSTIPFLAIDEFEKTNPTPWVMERMFQIFDRRYNLSIHGEAATLIASNLEPKQFKPEFSSRLKDGRGLVITLEGIDVRPVLTREDKF